MDLTVHFVYNGHMTRSYSRYSDEEIAAVISESRNLTEAAEILGINRKTVQRVAWERDIETTGERRYVVDHDKMLNTPRTQRMPHIRRYIRKHELLPYECLKCGQGDSWQDEELVLELDHINGDPCDNRLENLRWLCPNCHTQTPTWRGKART